MRSYIYMIVIMFTQLGQFSCSYNSEPYYLKNDYILKSNNVITEYLNGDILPCSEYCNAMKFIVYDSLCILYSWSDPRGFFNVLNVNTGEELGTYCVKGRGPNESTGVSHIFEISNNEGTLYADIIDVHNQRLCVWNITQSVNDKATIYDTIHPFDWSKDAYTPYRYVFKLDDNHYLINTSFTILEASNQVVAPSFITKSLSADSIERMFNIFPDSITTIKEKGNWQLSDFVMLESCIRPDKKQIAMAMSFYPQINILDVNSGDMKCYRLEDSPKISLEKRIWYHTAICCDERNIYVLYNNNLDILEEVNDDIESFVHIFDWDGNLTRKISVGGLFQEICVHNNVLYTLNSMTGVIAKYQL